MYGSPRPTIVIWAIGKPACRGDEPNKGQGEQVDARLIDCDEPEATARAPTS